MSKNSRKVRREAVIQARKSFRKSIKDSVVLLEWQKRYQQGLDDGYQRGWDAHIEEIRKENYCW